MYNRYHKDEQTTQQQVPHERVVMPHEPTREMLQAAMSEAVANGLLPRVDWEERVDENWRRMRAILTAALKAA